MAQKEEERAARGVHEVLPKKMGRDKVQTNKKKKKKKKKKKRQEVNTGK